MEVEKSFGEYVGEMLGKCIGECLSAGMNNFFINMYRKEIDQIDVRIMENNILLKYCPKWRFIRRWCLNQDTKILMERRSELQARIDELKQK